MNGTLSSLSSSSSAAAVATVLAVCVLLYRLTAAAGTCVQSVKSSATCFAPHLINTETQSSGKLAVWIYTTVDATVI